MSQPIGINVLYSLLEILSRYINQIEKADIISTEWWNDGMISEQLIAFDSNNGWITISISFLLLILKIFGRAEPTSRERAGAVLFIKFVHATGIFDQRRFDQHRVGTGPAETEERRVFLVVHGRVHPLSEVSRRQMKSFNAVATEWDSPSHWHQLWMKMIIVASFVLVPAVYYPSNANFKFRANGCETWFSRSIIVSFRREKLTGRLSIVYEFVDRLRVCRKRPLMMVAQNR